MRIRLAVLGVMVLLGALVAGCCGPCVAAGRLAAEELGARAGARPTTGAPAEANPTEEGRPVWFDLWAEGTTLHRSQGEARIDYRMLAWCIYEGDISRLQRAADDEVAFDMGWMRPGAYTVWLKAWWDGSYHQVSDKITVEVQR